MRELIGYGSEIDLVRLMRRMPEKAQVGDVIEATKYAEIEGEDMFSFFLVRS